MFSFMLRLLSLSFLAALLRRRPGVVRLETVVHDPRALARDLLFTGSAPALVFHDAPALQALPRRRRLQVANALALEASRVCPAYAGTTSRDLVFCAHLPGPGQLRAYEAALARVGGRVRRAAAGGEPAGPWVDLSPERALDLEQVLRGTRARELPAVVDDDRPEDVWGDVWWLVRFERGRHHVLRRRAPVGAERALLVTALGLAWRPSSQVSLRCELGLYPYTEVEVKDRRGDTIRRLQGGGVTGVVGLGVEVTF